MKKMIRYISAALVALMAVACAQQDQSVKPAMLTSVQFTANLAAEEGVRAGYLAGVKSHWDAGDKVTVRLNSTPTNAVFTQVDGSLSEDGRTATYSAEGVDASTIDDEIFAVYLPATEPAANGNVRITLPGEQTYVKDGYTAIPLLATGSATVNGEQVTIDELTFRNYFAVLKINLTSTTGATVNSIVLTDAGDQTKQIAGRVLTYPEDNKSDVIRAWNGTPAYTSITLNCDGVTLSEEPTAFYIVVPSGDDAGDYDSLHTFTDGIQMTVQTNYGNVVKKTPAFTTPFAENTIYDLPTLAIEVAKPAGVYMPDAALREYLIGKGYVTATTNELYVELTDTGKALTELKISTSNVTPVSFEGVGAFTNLTTLEIRNHKSKCTDETLDLSAMTALKKVIIDRNNFTHLDLSNNTQITQLYCYGNQMSELDVRMLVATSINLRVGDQQNDGVITVYMRSDQTNTGTSNNNYVTEVKE